MVFLLTLIMGRAGSGKTMFVMNDFRQKMEAGESDLLFVVPEQYSHDAERQLCAVCGDRLSLHGETLSFTRMCGRVFSETGGVRGFVDIGAQIIMMHRAIESIASKLKVYGMKGLRTELIENLLAALKELKSHNISTDMLTEASKRTDGALADKICDLTLIFSAYEGLMSERANDPSDKLTMLADMIGESSLGNEGHIYFDGFNDFTLQELRVIEELLRKNADLTICLTYDPDSGGEVFELPRKTVGRLRRLAEKYGAALTETVMEPSEEGRARELAFLEKHLFEYGAAGFSGDCRAITLYCAPTKYAECEYAARTIHELVRAGYRWRDTAVMARDWEEYRSLCENVFEKYGVPFFSGGRADVMEKPPIALIGAALDIAVGGWEYKPVFKYLKTGLAGIPPDGCCELENYVLKWNIRGALWNRVWTLPPSGYGGQIDETTLSNLNSLRNRTVGPIMRLWKGIKGTGPAGEKLRALYAFFDEIDLPRQLEQKARMLEKRGETRLADEYAQLLDIINNAVEQMFEMLGDTLIDAAEFRKLLNLVISQYDVGVIPTSIDRAALGGMAMSRRRDIKCLIILGATDDKLPMLTKGGGALSDSEWDRLKSLGLDVPAGIEERLSREMNMLYSTFTQPSEKLVVVYPAGAGERPSFIVKRIKALFGITETSPCEEQYMEMAGAAFAASREKLSSASAERLYGREMLLSPSRVDNYYSCPYRHFLYNGLRLDSRVRAGLDAPQAGIFLHFVLEGVASEIKAGAGFKMADEALCRALTSRYVERYIDEMLHGFEGKNSRFIYLFRRLEEDASRIALDMIDELKNSDFEPVDFELDLSELGGAVRDITEDHLSALSPRLTLRGVIDRVDGWMHEDRMYIRVIDYKTGKKSFSLSDVMYGRDLQMLIYLFALHKYGEQRYGAEILPSGVLYVPARDVIIKAPRNTPDSEIEKMRARDLRRGGLVLSDPVVLEAMENGGNKRFLPVKYSKDGAVSGDSLITGEQTALLSGHVDRMLRDAARRILGGSIQRSPYYKSDTDNACIYCQYRTVCGFDMELGDTRRVAGKIDDAGIWETLRTADGVQLTFDRGKPTGQRGEVL